MNGLPLGTVSGLVLLLLLAISTLTDISGRKIFNWATYNAAAWALAINFIANWLEVPQLGAIGLKQSLVGFTGCFVVMLFPYILARGGAGDVKLAAAIGAVIGFEQGLVAIAASYIVAGISILLWSIWCRGPWTLLVALGRLVGSMVFPLWIARPTSNDKSILNQPIPLAGFFAIGTLVVVLEFI